MDIIIFTHPSFQDSQSMPKYANMLANGMRERGHNVEMWTAKSFFCQLPVSKGLKKWLGYLDQFVVFPLHTKLKLKRHSKNTLFVFADHALGPWVPLVNNRPHVVHCHDFIAQHSALNRIPENRIRFTGKIYQKWIRRGYQKAENFISISIKTREDLHDLLNKNPSISEVVYNGLNQKFEPGEVSKVRKILQKQLIINLQGGFLLHVGGNQFYKNRGGVIKLYLAWRSISSEELPLIMIGPVATAELIQLKNNSIYKKSIHFVTDVPDELLKLAYQGASLLIFPSMEEGFGWPIAEAMASGCPVITTNKAPMTEVGGNAAFYLPRRPVDSSDVASWAQKGAEVINKVLSLTAYETENVVEAGLQNIERFKPFEILNKTEAIYKKIITAS